MPLSKRRYLDIISLVVILMGLLGTVYAQDQILLQSARSTGMGGAYLAVGDDVNSISANPAGLMRLRRSQLSGNYTRYFTGQNIGSIQEGSLFFSPFTWNRFFYGLGVTYFSHDIYRQQNASLVIGRELWRKGNKARIGLAINANLLRIDYNRVGFSEDFDPNDPVFRNGESKFSYGADVGLLAEYGPVSLGVKGYNLNEPDISLRGNATGGKMTRKVRSGLSVDILDYVTPVAEIEIPVTSEETVSDEMSYSFGLESWFVNDMVGARAGYSGDMATLGVSFRTRSNWDLGFDYSVEIPIDAPTEIGQTHKVTVNIGMAKPRRVITDISVDPKTAKPDQEIVSVKDTSYAFATISNVGLMDAKKFPVSLFYVEDGKSKIVGEIKVDELKSGEDIDVTIPWVPQESKAYELYISANDYGNKFPEIHHEVLEEDYENNTATLEVACFNPPSGGDIQLAENELIISTVSRVNEEIPVVPSIHFQENKSQFSLSRFDPTLRSYADRLNKNPGTSLILYGYYDPQTEESGGGQLAIQRAQNIKDRLVELGVPSNRIEVIREGYSMGKPRVDSESSQSEDIEMIREENRRVEIFADVCAPGKECAPQNLGVYDYPDFEIRPSREDREECKQAFTDVMDYLKSNQDIMVIFNGKSAALEEDALSKAHQRAVELRDIIKEWAPAWLRERLLVLASEDRLVTPEVKVSLSADALVFRPRGATSTRERIEFADFGTNTITIGDIDAEAGLDSFAVVVMEEESSRPFATLATGTEEVPEEIEWNWLGDLGQPPNPDKRYYVQVYAKDKYGQTLMAVSDPLSISLSEQEERKEMFLINFNFGKAEAVSEYLEARIEALAANLIERATYLGPNARIKAQILGHTDVVGSDEANQELSLQRAEKEYKALRWAMIEALELESQQQLDDWLKKHRVDLSYEGMADKNPMTVRYWEQGYWREEKVGDNDEPEGRLINRRVVLEVEIIAD